MPDSPFTIGEVVIDRGRSRPTRVVVVNQPDATAADWRIYGGLTVATAHPGYPADAPVVLVVDVPDVDRYLPDWDGRTPLSEATLDDQRVYYEAVPAPRLTPTSASQSDETDGTETNGTSEGIVEADTAAVVDGSAVPADADADDYRGTKTL